MIFSLSTKQKKYLKCFAISVLVLTSAYLLYDIMANWELMDPSTAGWIEQPTDIVMPSINEDSLKDRTFPTYIDHGPVLTAGDGASSGVMDPSSAATAAAADARVATSPAGCKLDDVTKSHLIFKDGVVPRDYETQASVSQPEDIMVSSDLLPKDDNNTWSDVNPQGTGSVSYKNFLDVGHHIGQINVLRNADLSIRTEVPNPQFSTGPWSQSTIISNSHLNNDGDVCM
jgi:hypothetical protein